ncbi:MAG: hypothetical protein V1822_01055 [Candidatus Micrarchaeota archaeon]
MQYKAQPDAQSGDNRQTIKSRQILGSNITLSGSAIEQKIENIISISSKPNSRTDKKLEALICDYENSDAGMRGKISILSKVAQYCSSKHLALSAKKSEDALIGQICFLSQEDSSNSSEQKLEILEGIPKNVAKNKEIASAIHKAEQEQNSYTLNMQTQKRIGEGKKRISNFYSSFGNELDADEYEIIIQSRLHPEQYSNLFSDLSGFSKEDFGVFKTSADATNAGYPSLYNVPKGYSQFSDKNIEDALSKFSGQAEKEKYLQQMLQKLGDSEPALRGKRGSQYLSGERNLNEDSNEEARRNLGAWLLGVRMSARQLLGQVQDEDVRAVLKRVISDADMLEEAVRTNWNNVKSGEFISQAEGIFKKYNKAMEENYWNNYQPTFFGFFSESPITNKFWAPASKFVERYSPELELVGLGVISFLQPEIGSALFFGMGTRQIDEGIKNGNANQAIMGALMCVPGAGRVVSSFAKGSKLVKGIVKVADIGASSGIMGSMSYEIWQTARLAGMTYWSFADFMKIGADAGMMFGLPLASKTFGRAGKLGRAQKVSVETSGEKTPAEATEKTGVQAEISEAVAAEQKKPKKIIDDFGKIIDGDKLLKDETVGGAAAKVEENISALPQTNEPGISNVPPLMQWPRLGNAPELGESAFLDVPYQVQHINEILGGTYKNYSPLKGKFMLDLGAGSTEGKYQPLACNALYEAGAVVVGVDIGTMENTPYLAFGGADLSKPGALNALPSGSFDVINMRLLLGVEDPVSLAPALRQMANEAMARGEADPIPIMKKEMFSQAERLLKEGGYFIADESVYQKAGGKLQRLGTLEKVRGENRGKILSRTQKLQKPEKIVPLKKRYLQNGEVASPEQVSASFGIKEYALSNSVRLWTGMGPEQVQFISEGGSDFVFAVRTSPQLGPTQILGHMKLTNKIRIGGKFITNVMRAWGYNMVCEMKYQPSISLLSHVPGTNIIEALRTHSVIDKTGNIKALNEEALSYELGRNARTAVTLALADGHGSNLRIWGDNLVERIDMAKALTQLKRKDILGMFSGFDLKNDPQGTRYSIKDMLNKEGNTRMFFNGFIDQSIIENQNPKAADNAFLDNLIESQGKKDPSNFAPQEIEKISKALPGIRERAGMNWQDSWGEILTIYRTITEQTNRLNLPQKLFEFDPYLLQHR